MMQSQCFLFILWLYLFSNSPYFRKTLLDLVVIYTIVAKGIQVGPLYIQLESDINTTHINTLKYTP